MPGVIGVAYAYNGFAELASEAGRSAFATLLFGHAASSACGTFGTGPSRQHAGVESACLWTCTTAAGAWWKGIVHTDSTASCSCTEQLPTLGACFCCAICTCPLRQAFDVVRLFQGPWAATTLTRWIPAPWTRSLDLGFGVKWQATLRTKAHRLDMST